MNDLRHSEGAFETVVETHLLASGYTPVPPEGFDREHAIFPETVLAFIRETQRRECAKLEVLHGERTGEQVRSFTYVSIFHHKGFKHAYEFPETGPTRVHSDRADHHDRHHRRPRGSGYSKVPEPE